MYLIYLLPLFLIVLVALGIFAGPVLAVILFLLFLVGLGAYKFLARGTDPEHATTAGRLGRGRGGNRHVGGAAPLLAGFRER